MWGAATCGGAGAAIPAALAPHAFRRTTDNAAAAIMLAFMFYSGIVFVKETRAPDIRRRMRRLRFVE
jgi:hypothetical protein